MRKAWPPPLGPQTIHLTGVRLLPQQAQCLETIVSRNAGPSTTLGKGGKRVGGNDHGPPWHRGWPICTEIHPGRRTKARDWHDIRAGKLDYPAMRLPAALNSLRAPGSSDECDHRAAHQLRSIWGHPVQVLNRMISCPVITADGVLQSGHCQCRSSTHVDNDQGKRENHCSREGQR